MNSAAIAFVHEQLTGKKEYPKFKAVIMSLLTIELLKVTKSVSSPSKVM
jgi:hypothetical protein